MAKRSLLSLWLMLALLQSLEADDGFNLADALDTNNNISATPSTKPAAPGGGPGKQFPLATTATTTTTIKPKGLPKGPASSKAPAKPKAGGFSNQDLYDVSKDDTYKPDKGKGKGPGGERDRINQVDENTENTQEVGTIAGIASAVAMALVGAISSYISYQKKKLCFSMQQSLNTDMVKAENPEAVVATEPQVQQTLLQPANAEPPTDENTV
ncbi:CD99 antigen-like protein 2 isoform X2 [Channa argus]|uniref:CD99 antigen-like protein 2 isoform X2 n=1 Tax=Channa argus TaxID=215402 RepID=UPI0035225ABB